MSSGMNPVTAPPASIPGRTRRFSRASLVWWRHHAERSQHTKLDPASKWVRIESNCHRRPVISNAAVGGTIGPLLSLKATWPKRPESPSPVGEWQPWDGVKIARHVIGAHGRTMTMADLRQKPSDASTASRPRSNSRFTSRLMPLSVLARVAIRAYAPPAFFLVGIVLDRPPGILLETSCPVSGAAPEGVETR